MPTAEVRVVNVHLPSSNKRKFKPADITGAMSDATSFAANSREAFCTSCGDINEKHRSNMVDRLRNAHFGAGHWRHWEPEAQGEGDHIVYSQTLERLQHPWFDAECREVFFQPPHYMQGGLSLPSSPESLQAFQRSLALPET